MKRSTLLWRGLVHYRRTHLGVLCGSMVATATLVGALVVGDSVRHSLGQVARARIGRADAALSSGDRFFTESLATALAEAAQNRVVAPVVQVGGVVSTSDGGQRVHDVRVHGVDERFFQLSPAGVSRVLPARDMAYANAGFAARLGIEPGDSFVLRVERPSAIPRDMALSTDDVSIAVRLELGELLSDDDFGRFALHAAHAPPSNLFLALDWLQEELEVAGRANLLLVDLDASVDTPEDGDLQEGVEALQHDLRELWSLSDAELEFTRLEDRDEAELSTGRIFFDDPIVEQLETLGAIPHTAIFTYFVNSLSLNGQSTPYSMVSALGSLTEQSTPLPGTDWTRLVPPDLGNDGIVLNQWLAEDLQAAPGDLVSLAYFVVDPSAGGTGRLVERTRELRVHSVVPLSGTAADPSLMPAFPGLQEADSCRDWEPGTPVDLDRIRDKDEEYWEAHHGTPKAFVTLQAGREMWHSRFGSLTALRFSVDDEERVRSALTAGLDPALLGLFFRDVRTAALASGDSPTDFGGLFLGLSFFLILAALLLATQLFLFGIEARASEIGLLCALGFSRQLVRRQLFSEALVLALVGAGAGALLGLGYTRLVLLGLETVWREAVASVALTFHATPATVVLGMFLSVTAVSVTVWWALRRKDGAALAALLVQRAGVEPETDTLRNPKLQKTLVVVVLAGAVALALGVDPDSGPRASGAFFGAGALVLTGGLLACRLGFRRGSSPGARPVHSLLALGVSNTRRRPGRSLATVALVAIGSFLIISIGAFQQGSTQNLELASSGTGGFQLYGRSSLPVLHDLNGERGRAAFGLAAEDLEDVSVVALKVRGGDEASCLNLAKPALPRLLGVDPEALARRASFTFSASSATDPDEESWRLLEGVLPDGSIPAVGDAISLQWQLHIGIGDTLAYRDERGASFDIRIVGALADTILQGDLLISSTNFGRLFPSDGGFRRFLIDAPGERTDAVAGKLTRALEDVGLSLESTGARLDAFHSVQNSYLAIFQVLGAIGLLLGSVGLGMVVLRNTLERRSELALVAALGFRAGDTRRLLLYEYGVLLACGLGTGGVAALLAILPSLWTPGRDLSLTNALGLVVLVAANGFLWILLAARSADARAPLSALGEE